MRTVVIGLAVLCCLSISFGQNSAPKHMRGTVVSVDCASYCLTIVDNQGINETFSVDPNATVVFRGKDYPLCENGVPYLQPEDQVRVCVSSMDGKVMATKIVEKTGGPAK
jgi:hypothetical protein